MLRMVGRCRAILLSALALVETGKDRAAIGPEVHPHRLAFLSPSRRIVRQKPEQSCGEVEQNGANRGEADHPRRGSQSLSQWLVLQDHLIPSGNSLHVR